MWYLLDDVTVVLTVLMICATLVALTWLVLAFLSRRKRKGVDMAALAKSIEAQMPGLPTATKMRMLQAMVQELEEPIKSRELLPVKVEEDSAR